MFVSGRTKLIYCILLVAIFGSRIGKQSWQKEAIFPTPSISESQKLEMAIDLIHFESFLHEFGSFFWSFWPSASASRKQQKVGREQIEYEIETVQREFKAKQLLFGAHFALTFGCFSLTIRDNTLSCRCRQFNSKWSPNAQQINQSKNPPPATSYDCYIQFLACSPSTSAAVVVWLLFSNFSTPLFYLLLLTLTFVLSSTLAFGAF